MTKGLTSAIINSPTFDPTAETPWTFKQWEEQARKCHLKWKAAAKFTQTCQGLFQAFKLFPKQNYRKNNNNQGRNNYWRNNKRTTSQGGYHMDVDATVTTDINATAGGGQQHSETKKAELMRSNSCFYCKKQGHCASNCRKKQADHGNFSSQRSNPREPARAHITPTMPDIQDLDSFANYLKDNMDSFSEDARLGFIEKLMPKAKDFQAALN